MEQPNSKTTFIDVIYHFVRSPGSFLGLFGTLLGLNGYQYGRVDLMDTVFMLTAAVLVIAMVRLILWLLPHTYQVVFIWCVTIIISMLSMGWCLNNEEKCRLYYVYTESKSIYITNTAKDYAMGLYGQVTRPATQ